MAQWVKTNHHEPIGPGTLVIFVGDMMQAAIHEASLLH